MTSRRFSFEPSSVAPGVYVVWERGTGHTRWLGDVQRRGDHSWAWCAPGMEAWVGLLPTRRAAAEMLLDLLTLTGPTDKENQDG